MPLTERISQMKKQGLNDETITTRLQEEGISPREINEALDQTRVNPAAPEREEMQPSIMPTSGNNLPAPPETPAPVLPTSQEIPPPTLPPTPLTPEEALTQPVPPAPEAPPMQPQPPLQTMPPQEAVQPTQPAPPLTQETPEEAYPYPYEYPEYEYQAAATDTEMITEIAEQLVAEKLQKINKQIAETAKFKTEVQGKVKNIDERLKRIEIMIDRLQTSILGKIGDYGKDISDLKSEMITTQESFSKILNPLTENIEELRRITGAETETKKTKTKTKTGTTRSRKKSKGNGFENYLRK